MINVWDLIAGEVFFKSFHGDIGLPTKVAPIGLNYTERQGCWNM